MGTLLRILIADRSDDDYALLVRHLKAYGFEPECIKVNGINDISDYMAGRPWDVLISDAQPDGIRILDILREKGRGIPLILLSGAAEDRDDGGFPLDGTCYAIHRERLPQLLPVIVGRLREAEEGQTPQENPKAHRPCLQQAVAVLEEMEEAYFEIDLLGRIVFLNAFFSRFLQYPEEELVGATFRMLMDTDTADRVEKMFQNVCVTGIQAKCIEMELIRKDGTKCWFETSAVPIRDSDGMVVGIRGIGRDISSRKDVESDLLRSSKVESVGILAGGIAHDFNNLLSIILGYISIARTLIDPEEEASLMLKKAEKAGFQATELTKRLITFSRGDEPWRKLTHLAPLLKKAADFSLVGTEIRFSYFIPEDLWPVNIDEGQMWQVVRNLVMNAGEAMPEGGIITVAADNVNINEFTNLPLQEGAYVRWSVTDQGTGILSEHLPRIFDPYFTTKGMGAKQGMGLGLAICFSIIRKHEGFITVDSTPGAGTTFYVYLPAVPTEFLPEAEAGDRRLMRKQRILVMDDEEDIRDIFQKLLMHLGYDAELASDGGEAIDKFREAKDLGYPFSAVILDLVVKDGLGGKVTLKKLLQIEPDLKAIVTTGYADDPIVTHFRYYGFVGTLIKPFAVKELQGSLEAILSEKGLDDLPLFQQ